MASLIQVNNLNLIVELEQLDSNESTPANTLTHRPKRPFTVATSSTELLTNATSHNNAESSDSGEVCARQVEIRVITKAYEFNVLLVFEGFPVWLLGLEQSPIRNLYIAGCHDRQTLVEQLNLQQQPGVIVTQLLNHFSKDRVIFGKQTSFEMSNLLTLVSGSIHYIDSMVSSLSRSATNQVIGVLDHHFHGRLRNGGPSGLAFEHRTDWNYWTRVRHETVGGTTRHVGLFCSSFEFSPVIVP
jgi:hypothetical protein